VANLRYKSVKNIYLNPHLAPKLMQQVSSAVEQAARFDPFNGFYPFLLGDVARYQDQRHKAFEYYLQAGRKDPLEGAYLQRIAYMLPQKYQHDAEDLMAKGAERTLNKDDLTLSQAQWLLEIDKKEKAIGVLRQALVQNPRLVTEVIQMLQSFSFSRKEIAEVLPASVDEWIRYGAYLEETGDIKGAEYFYDHAVDFLKNATKIQPEWFSRLYSFYRKRKQTEKAVDILRLGIKKNPDYAPFHVWLGDYYAEEGISYRAIEEYQQALLLEPENAAVMKKIEELTKGNEL
jgi:tetratricopeptide (TPR) repeat protein